MLEMLNVVAGRVVAIFTCNPIGLAPRPTKYGCPARAVDPREALASR